METVDVVITTFNETTRLFRAVASAKSQTLPVQKIWVIDDGSDPRVVEQIGTAFRDDPQVEIVSLGHSGIPGISRKSGISRSSADWIAFLDADDYWHESKIMKQLSLAGEYKATLVYTNALKVGAGVSGTYFSSQQFREKLLPRHMIKENCLINSSVLVRRSKLIEIDLYADLANVRAVEDYATWLRLSATLSFSGLSEPLTFYTISESSLSREVVVDRRPFALVDFLSWSKNRKHDRLISRVKFFLFRTRVLFQLLREQFP
jgi:glycosyltransferase involved in cell wall biosynthesis